MDHDATREQLELAAAEPGGLERLMAGDTPAAQGVAAHLAGCPGCTDELARLERAAALIREVVGEQAPADLRERTLAAVMAAGRPRTAPAAPGGTPPLPLVGVAAGVRPGRPGLGWAAAIAAAIVLSVVATSVIVGGRVDERLATLGHTVDALQEITAATLQVTAESDARRVRLAGADPGMAGNIVFSPSTSELVVVATGLTPPPAGQEYRCWVEEAGDRQRVGRMFFAEDLAYWVGPVPAVEGLVDAATFGVSLVNLDGSPVDSPPVLGGGL